MDCDKINIVSSIYNKYPNYFKIKSEIYLDQNLYSDLDIYKKKIGLLDRLNQTYTCCGKEYLKNTLKYPELNYNYYQNKYQEFEKLSTTKISKINSIFKKMKDREDDLIWFWEQRTKEEKELMNKILFKYNHYYDFNRHQSLLISNYSLKLYIQPIYSILSPTLSIIIPYIVLKYQFKLPISIDTYIRLIKIILPTTLKFGYGSMLFSSKTLLFILFIFLYIYNFYNLILDIVRLININSLVYKKLESIKLLLVSLKELCIDLGEIFPSYEPDWVTKMCLLQKNYFGNTIYQYYNLVENYKPTLEKYIILLGKLDHIFAIWKYTVSVKQIGYPICFSNFNQKKEINLKIHDIWNLNLYQKNPVLNSIQLGGDGVKNLIVTGPNAGGKTTLLKAIFYNILLSSLYGFSLSSCYDSSQFTYLFSHINKFDKINEYSLFQSEISHFSEIFQTIKNHHFYFGILDELFTSTTPEEGASCAYAISEYLGKNTGMIIVTTHFRILSQLEQSSNDFFNVSMGFKNNKFTYFVEKGENHIHLAINLLNNYKNTNKVYNKARFILDKIC